MNSKQLGIFVVVGLILGGLAFLVLKKNAEDYQAGTSQIGRKLLPDLPINDVVEMTIRSDSGSVNLVKSNETWTVRERSGYPANFGNISQFLRNLWDLKILNSQTVDPSQLSRLELAEPGQGQGSGTLVELKDQSGKVIETIVLGKQHMSQGGGNPQFGGGSFPDGRYLMVKGQDSNVVLVNEPFSNIEPSPDSWLNKDFFKIQKIRSVDVTHPEPEESWSLSRTNETGKATMEITDPDKELDSSKASRVMSMLSFPSFNDVYAAEGADLAEYGLDEPVVARVQTFEGFHYTIQLGTKEGEEDSYLTVAVEADLNEQRQAAEGESEEDKQRLDTEFQAKLTEQKTKLENEKELAAWIYQVSKWTVEPALFKKSDLIKEKSEEEEGDSINALPQPSTMNPPIPDPSALNLDPLNSGIEVIGDQVDQAREAAQDAVEATADAVEETVESVEKTLEPEPAEPEVQEGKEVEPTTDSEPEPTDPEK